jgi:hypothetical protein
MGSETSASIASMRRSAGLGILLAVALIMASCSNVNQLTSQEKAEGFVPLFNGKNLDNWVGAKDTYFPEDGNIVVKLQGSGGNLYTAKEYADFIFRFDFQLTPGANNGIGIRTPLEGDAACVGMEIQGLDNTAPEVDQLLQSKSR